MIDNLRKTTADVYQKVVGKSQSETSTSNTKSGSVNHVFFQHYGAQCSKDLHSKQRKNEQN